MMKGGIIRLLVLSMSPNESSVCIPTIDPRIGGGALTVSKFVYRMAQKDGYDPILLYNSQPWENCVTIFDLARGDWGVPCERQSYEGLEGIQIGRLLPEIQSFNYLLNYKLWKCNLSKFDKILGVGGVCLPCIPAALSNEKFSCWIGTTYVDECMAQVPHYAAIRRARDRLEFPIIKQFEKYVLRKSHHVAVQSEYTKRRVMDLYSINENKISVIPFPIDCDKYKPNDEYRANSKEVVFVGRFSTPRKNLPFLLKSVKKLCEKLENVTLTLIGDTLNSEIRNKISDFDLDSVVCLPGYVDNIVPYLQKADVFAFPSRQEGLGIAGLEAMACGLPVVSTKSGGPEDYVIDGKTGYLVDQGDSESFARSLEIILEDGELQSDLGDNAREHILKNYSLQTVGPEIQRMLEI